MKHRLFAASLSLALLACSDSIEPTAGGVLGCHVLAASKLSNGAPARSALVRIDGNEVHVIGDVAKATTAGYESGRWTLEDGPELRLSFGSGFVGVNYTFNQYHGSVWSGDVEYWVDTPTLNGDGTAVLTRTICP